MGKVLKESGRPYQVNPGEGAFYGPKIDFHLRDSLGRTWQCSTIQLDFAQPENFNLSYIDEKGEKKRPVMIHRVIYGSLERFLGILIENCGGAFPLWLSPVQAKIIPISDKELSYSRNVFEKAINWFSPEDLSLARRGNLYQTLDFYPGIVNKDLGVQLFSNKIKPKSSDSYRKHRYAGDARLVLNYDNVKPVQPIVYKPKENKNFITSDTSLS